MIRPVLHLVFLAARVARKDAPTPAGPPRQGPNVTGPALVVRPGLDTLVDSIPLNPLKNPSFEYAAPAVDVLGHETVTDTVTVTVK